MKDESQRLHLDSFKVLGGSFAIYQFLRKRLGIRDRELTISELKSRKIRAQLGILRLRPPPTATTPRGGLVGDGAGLQLRGVRS